MDTGHYNCRDYHISPHFAPPTITSDLRPHMDRHESFDELMHRSRSPASFKPKFPLLHLPLELRQHIYSYLIPRTQELRQSNPLGSHARNFSAVQRRSASGMALPRVVESARSSNSERDGSMSNVVWQRGNINMLMVCRQTQREYAEMMYGRNTFLLFVTYSGITFRFRWLLPSGLAPSRSYDFLDLLPDRYLRLVRKVMVHVDHVDSYTGMIKFNVSGSGLTHGIRKQVQRLVLALQPQRTSSIESQEDNHSEGYADEQRRLAKVVVRVSYGNAVIDSIKTIASQQRGKATPSDPRRMDSESTKGSDGTIDDVKDMLQPFGDLAGVREVRVMGAVFETFARALEERMRSTEARECTYKGSVSDAWGEKPTAPLCVYGNDMS